MEIVDKMNKTESSDDNDSSYKFNIEVKQNTYGRTPNVDDIQEMCLWADDKFDDDQWVWRGWVSYNTESVTAFAFVREEDAVLFALRWA